MSRSLIAKVCASAFIVVYLGVLGVGVTAHAFKIHQSSHPAMYVIVWDMFCGWSAWSERVHILAEGESGTHYELSPSPWEPYRPYGQLPRHEYDYLMLGAWEHAANVLRNTDHEPITRVVFVEENWSKKYNMPDHVWDRAFDVPKEKVSYFRTRAVLTPDGQFLFRKAKWQNSLIAHTMLHNPRLKAEVRADRPLFANSSGSGGLGGRSVGSSTAFTVPNAN